MFREQPVLILSRRSAAAALPLAFLAGFVASVAMVLAFAIAFVAALLLGQLPVPVLADWFRGLTHNQLINTAGPNLYTATAVFFLGGLIWALLYGVVFEPRLRGSAWERGVSFSLVPWVFSLVIFLPLVGGGFMGINLGAGPLPIIGNLVLHLVYGATLGLVYGSADSVIDRPLHRGVNDDLSAGHLAELGAVKGIVAGLALGIVIGAIGAILIPQGMNPMAMVVALGLTGAAFGALVGSLAAS
jgi:hypothetical protein